MSPVQGSVQLVSVIHQKLICWTCIENLLQGEWECDRGQEILTVIFAA